MMAYDTTDAHEDCGERRSFDRIAMEVEVSLESESQFFAGITGDVSSGGVFVSTYNVLPVGARVFVDLQLPSGTLRVRGTVRWLRDVASGAAPGIGIAFDRLAPNDVAMIDAVCARRSPLYFEDANDAYDDSVDIRVDAED